MSIPRPASPRAPRRWIRVGIDTLVTNPFPLFVEKSQRLLKKRWRRRTGRRGSLADVETAFGHVDRCESAGLIGGQELQPMSFDLVGVVVRVKSRLDVPFRQ